MSEGNKNVSSPIQNEALENIIANIKKENTPESQKQLVEELKTAKFLSPCSIDEKVKSGKAKMASDSIRLFFLNTNDGKTFLPVFTNFEKTKSIQFGKEKADFIVHTMKEFGALFSSPDNKMEGIIINPNQDQFVIPKNLILALANSMKPKQTEKPKQNHVVRPVYSEPRVYPTRMVTAVYDAVSQIKGIKRVWLKQKLVGPVMTFVLVVDGEGNQEEISNTVKEVAAPLTKGVGVEVLFYNDFVENEIVKGAVALYDSELEL